VSLIPCLGGNCRQLLRRHPKTKDDAVGAYEEAKSLAVAAVGALGMVPVYICCAKAQVWLERGYAWNAYEALMPGLRTMNERTANRMPNAVDPAELLTLPTIARTFASANIVLATMVGEAMLQLGQIEKVGGWTLLLHTCTRLVFCSAGHAT